MAIDKKVRIPWELSISIANFEKSGVFEITHLSWTEMSEAERAEWIGRMREIQLFDYVRLTTKEPILPEGE